MRQSRLEHVIYKCCMPYNSTLHASRTGRRTRREHLTRLRIFADVQRYNSDVTRNVAAASVRANRPTVIIRQPYRNGVLLNNDIHAYRDKK